MVWVDGRAFGRAATPVFTGRRTERLVGLVDAYEDPADVYRIRVRKRSRVRVIAKPRFGDPVLAGFSSGTKSLAQVHAQGAARAPAAGDVAPQGQAHRADHAAQPHGHGRARSTSRSAPSPAPARSTRATG